MHNICTTFVTLCQGPKRSHFNDFVPKLKWSSDHKGSKAIFCVCVCGGGDTEQTAQQTKEGWSSVMLGQKLLSQ